MSYMIEQARLRRMVRDIHSVNGLIAEDPQGADRPVFPHRDKRKRPVIWIEQASFVWLRGQGMIAPVARGYILADSVVRRLENGQDGEALGQHQDREAVELYSPEAVRRPANINTRSTPLDRLARRRGREKNRRWLSAAEVEAGEALARDYHRAGEGAIASQDFAAAGVQGGDRNGAAERAMLARITASTRLRTAREILGEDLAPGIIALCCLQESLEAVERTERWAVGSGKQIVKLGLARLVRLYGTEPGARGGRR